MEWLNGWGNRALVEITYPTAGGQTYYQISLTVNYRPGMQEDFDDVRFTLFDGITELSYFKDSYTSSTSAIFWIKIPSVLAFPKITTIYMYWYNDGVPTTSSPQNTFLRTIDNALCYWDFNEESGIVVYDKLSSSVSGTLNGGALRVIENENDKSIYFDGVNDYMSWTYTKPSNNFSISFWAKAINTHQIDAETAAAGNTTGTSGQYYVVGSTNEGADAGIGVSLGTNGISVYGHGTAYMAPMAVASVAVGTGWRHIVITVTNKQPRIYLDSMLARTGQTCVKSNLYGPTRIGGDASYGYFRGYVNNFCIFNRVLTPTEISDLYAKETCYYTSSYQGMLVRKYVDPEPVVENIVYSTENMCAKDPYVFSCSVSGINIYDISSLALINNIYVDKLSSVWANEDYLFAGTSNSGIYKFNLSTIVAAPVAEIYKQYPDLTSNNIRYLNGGGNYLCAVTLSGVDRYNLNTDSRKYVNVGGANKCFQTSTGDFYFDLYTDLVAMYNDNTLFTYTSDNGNILYTYSTYDVENACIIHDIFVTVGTSANDNANTIFLATVHGVVIIEEKRGDEENARRRYYISRYNFLEEQEEVETIEHKGYVMGYSTIIEAFNFINESSYVISSTLSSAQDSGAGVNSSIKGYIMGGIPVNVNGKRVVVLVFNTELNNISFATLSTNRIRSTGVNSTIKGYVMGGVNGSEITIIESLAFSIEASNVITATIDIPSYHGVGTNSSIKGYCMGGYSGGSLISIEALVFDVETSAIISATLNVGKRGGAGTNSITKGYFFGGITSTYIKAINAISFATEVCSLLAATLSVNNSYGAGINNSTKGYCLGGYTGVVYVNNIERMIFDTEAVSVLSVTLSTTRYGDVGVQSGSL